MVFQRCELRTTDPEGARAFYRTLAGDTKLSIVPLPARAQERGAPSHWLGHLGVHDVAAARLRWMEAGATPLGPTRADGVAALKDPFGSPVALAPLDGGAERAFAKCELHAADVDAAWDFYREHRDWELQDRGTRPVRYLRFIAHSVDGSIVETVGKGAHPPWLFYLPVLDLDAALVSVCDAGARPVLGPVDSVLGRVAALDDPFGAAFGIVQR
ncbi:MAG: VOC family protein [Sandaracinaceae bacterium]